MKLDKKLKPKIILFSRDDDGEFHLVYKEFRVRIASNASDADDAIEELKTQLTKIQEEIRDNY